MIKLGLPIFLLALCLFGKIGDTLSGGVLASCQRNVVSIFHDPRTQWVVFLCIGIYFIVFTLLKRCDVPKTFWNIDSWLAGVIFIGTLDYFTNYATASQSIQALILLAGTALAMGISVWISWTPQPGKRDYTVQWILISLIVMLALASHGHSEVARPFQYRSDVRWSGFWDNPNMFGLLMGTGVLLTFGLLIHNLILKGQGEKARIEVKTWKFKARKYAGVILSLLVVVLMGRGLLHSYSRGAWIATLFGIVYLGWQVAARSSKFEIQGFPSCLCFSSLKKSALKKNCLPVGIILFSAILLLFWQFQQVNSHLGQRAFSAVNTNDFSWRNRIASWEGALQIMANHFWLGTGWNQTELLYEHYYLPPKLNEGAAIEMNDYLMLGTMLGIPALFCFGTYLWLSLCQKSDVRPRVRGFLSATCRAGAIVLLIGFWFDGGLFKLPTASIFWILVGLGAVQLHKERQINETP